MPISILMRLLNDFERQLNDICFTLAGKFMKKKLWINSKEYILFEENKKTLRSEIATRKRV